MTHAVCGYHCKNRSTVDTCNEVENKNALS